MEFGLHLPNAGPFANGADVLRTAKKAEELGFHSVWLFDHLFTPTNLESKYPYSPDGSYPMLPEFPFYDPVSVMAALAAATERIKFGTRVLIATYRHPVVLAKELATTDAIAGGRMILGVGAGWMSEEFDAVDVPMEQRFARLDEHIALMREAWQKGTVAHEESAAKLRQDKTLIASSYLGKAAAEEQAVTATANGHAASGDLMEELILRLPAALMRALQEQAAKQGRQPADLLLEFLQGQEVEA